MTYPLFSIIVVISAITIALCIDRSVFKQPQTWLTLFIVFVLTIVFDHVLVSLPIVTYSRNALSGLAIWNIPVEDFSYTIAIVFITLAFKKHYDRIS